VTLETISAGGGHACGVTTTGTLVCWGSWAYQVYESAVPQGSFRQVTSGDYHDCALSTDDSVVCWGFGEDGEVGSCSGDEVCGQATPPPGEFLQIDAGTLYSCGVRLDGTVECWGNNDSGQSDAPEGTFKQVRCGSQKSCGVRPGGTIECWPGSAYAPRPEYRIAQLSVSTGVMCAITDDGLVLCP